MAEKTFLQAIRDAQYEEMQRDAAVFVMGEDVECNMFGTTTGMIADFGAERVRDTPIAEAGMAGVAAGAAMVGMRPIVDFTIAPFLYPAMDQIVSIIAKSRFLYGGQAKVPVVLRANMIYGNGNAAQHSDRPYSLFMNIPGLKIMVPSSAYDMKGLMKTAIRDDDPVMSFEDVALWSSKSETRLVLAARALGAARRGFALVIDHVAVREQFGQPLIRFQAIQMKLADCHVAITASAAMIDAAAIAVDRGAADAPMRIDAAVAFAAQHLRAASFELQHAFGAIGYAEEHEMPGLFRRIHTDLLLMGGIVRARGALATSMLDGTAHRLPRHDLGEAAEQVRARLIEWLGENWTPADRAAQRAKPFAARNRDAGFSRRLGDAGWLSAGWPCEAGGGGVSPHAQLAIVEELTRADAPVSANVAAAWLIAPEIIRHGSPALREQVLPGIRSGVVNCALGYSEPDAGSDLSALRTRAVRDGDAYRITGQKLWGTGADSATHIVVAARTDPDARPKRAGISLFLVPTDLPGITIVPTMAFYGHSFCTQFYDDVRVPATMMIGAENEGWGVLTGALAAERIQMGGNVVRLQAAFEALCAHLGQDRRRAEDPLVRDTIGALAAEIEAARLLARESVEMLEAGGVPIVEGAITKAFSGALAERFAVAAMDLIGSSALGGEDAAGTPLDGRLEWLLRQSIMMVIGGGAAEIQKGIIAAQWRAR